MSQDFLSQQEVDALLRGEVLTLERKVRYPEDGEKLKREEVIRMLGYEVQDCKKQIESAEYRIKAFEYAIGLIGAME